MLKCSPPSFLLLMVSVFLPLNLCAEQIITNIKLIGNKVTQEFVIKNEIAISEGAEFDSDLMEKSRQAIMDLGLFKKVKAKKIKNDEGVEIHFKMVERWFILPVPRVDRSADGVISIGGQIRFDNIFGLNQQLDLTAKQKREEEGEGDKSDVFKLKYTANKFNNSPYGFSFSYSNELSEDEVEEDGEVIGEVESFNDKVSFFVRREIKRWEPQNNWAIQMGIVNHLRKLKILSGSAGNRLDGRDLQFKINIASDQVHIEPNRRIGKTYGVKITWADELIRSDFNYYRYDLFYREYRPLPSSNLVNLNYQLRAGYSNGSNFGGQSYELGSSSTIRGIDKDEKSGNVLVLANVEYLHALHFYPRVRGVVFTDIGNVYPAHTLNLSKLEVTVGLGLRWKIASFVDTDLRVDIAYNPDTDETQAYAGTRHAF